MSNSIITIWKNKGAILEGIKNNIFKREDVEQVASNRMKICSDCPLFDIKGTGCMVMGTEPCCDQTKGGCGCSLKFKTRSLSSACPKGKWEAEMSEEEEDLLNKKLPI
jgi:hypothetical protein